MSQIHYLKYRPEIDGLRAVSVVLVIGFHAFPSVIQGGFIGVDIFFVISGYLISSILIQSFINSQFSFIDFYVRRIRRIFPALSVVLFSCLIFGWLSLTPYELSELGKHVGAGSGFISNFLLWKEAGYFDVDAYKKILLHLWSLGIEEQFYILWPLILWVCYRLKLNLLTPILFLLFLSFGLNVASIGHDRVSVFYHPGSRFWELLLGSVLAYMSIHSKAYFLNTPKIIAHATSLVGVLILLFGLIFLDQERSFPGWWALLPTFAGALIIASGSNSFINHKILSSPILVWIGLISFPLYLWHWPLLSFLQLIEGPQVSIWPRILVIVLAIILAWLTFRLVEKPIRQSVNKSTLILLLTAMIGVGVLGFYINNQNGFPGRNPIADTFRKNNWSYGWSNHGCSPEFSKISQDCISNSAKVPDILFMGDSHTQGLFLSLAELLPTANIMRLGVYLPLFDIGLKIGENEIQKSDDANRALWFAIHEKSIKTIIIGFRGVLNLVGTDFREGKELEHKLRSIRSPNSFTETDAHKIMESAFEVTMKRLSLSNKKVIFILDTPELGFDPEQCLETRPFHFSHYLPRIPCAVPRSLYELRNKEYRALVFLVLKRYPKITILDMQDKLCDSQWCWAMKDNAMLYMDDNHLSRDGSNFLAKELLIAIQSIIY